LRALGATAPAAFRRSIARIRNRPRAPAKPPVASPGGSSLEALAVALQRLLVPGAAPPLVQRELLSVTESFFPGRAPRLEEVDSNRSAQPLAGTPAPDEPITWVEFGDGAGRRLRLGVPGPLTPPEHALLAAIALAAGA